MTQNSNLNDKIRNVSVKFAASNIKVCNDWLSGCIEFFCSENPRISNEGLYENAREQWLLADLAEVGEGCLPNRILSEKEEFVLDKMYPVQLQWMLDISESCYDQLRNLYDKKTDEAVESNEFNTTRHDVKKNRVLKLELTDGKITIHALEYRPISCLSTKIPPGCKILLKGPIRCVNKILFLEPKNVQILGGEVDTLLIDNAFENILLKQLGKPLNPIPKTDYKEPIVIEYTSQPVSIPLAEQTPFVSHQSRQEVTGNGSRPPPKMEHHSDVIMDDDEFLLDINLDEIENRAVFMPQPPIKPATLPKSIIAMEEDEQFLDDLDVLNDIENQIQNEQNMQRTIQNVSEPATIKPNESDKNRFDDLIDDSNFFDSTMDFDLTEINEPNLIAPKRTGTILDDDYAFKVANTNLASIEELISYKADELDGKQFMIYCEIDSIAEKLQIKNFEYCLGVFLKDYTKQEIQVRFHTDVLSKLADYTPKELQLMRKTEKERPHFKEQINQILAKLKIVLQELKCFMKIAYDTNRTSGCHPTIIELIATNDDYTNILNNKKRKT